MPLTIERNETGCLIRVQGEFTVTLASELKNLLLEGLASAEHLQVDLTQAEEIDASLLELLWAAAREAARQNGRIVSGVSEAAAAAARDAGFDTFPGLNEVGGSVA